MLTKIKTVPLLIAAVLSFSVFVVTAPAASAKPTNCSSFISGGTVNGTATAICWGGTGQFRAVGGCKNVFG